MEPRTDFPDDLDLRSILLQSRRLGVRERTAAYSKWIRGVQRRGESLYHRVVSSRVDRVVTVRDDRTGEDREMLMFGSNNYLGLTNHPHVAGRIRAALDEFGPGVGSAPLLGGYLSLHRELEERLAAFKGAEAAVLYQSGYGANVGLLSAVVGKRDAVYYDERSHASTLDGLGLAAGAAVKVRHNDPADLGAHLAAHASAFPDGDAFVCVEGVYSMDGDVAPLDELVPTARAHGAFVVVDDAHGVGVVGRQGRGTADHFGVTGDVDATVATFSKTFGMTGGAVCTSRAVADYLRHFSRANVFSTSLPPTTVAGVLAGLDVLEAEGDDLVGRLHANVARLTRRLRAAGFDVAPESAVVPVPVPVGMSLRRVARFVHDQGVFANACEYPAVAVHRQRLRFSVMASHTPADMDRVADVLAEAWARFAPDGVQSDAAGRARAA